MTNRSYN